MRVVDLRCCFLLMVIEVAEALVSPKLSRTSTVKRQRLSRAQPMPTRAGAGQGLSREPLGRDPFGARPPREDGLSQVRLTPEAAGVLWISRGRHALQAPINRSIQIDDWNAPLG